MKENVKYISNDVSPYTVLMVVESADARSLMSISKIPFGPLLLFLLNQLNHICATIKKNQEKKNKPIHTSKSQRLYSQTIWLIQHILLLLITKTMINAWYSKSAWYEEPKNKKSKPYNLNICRMISSSVEFFIWEEKGKKNKQKMGNKKNTQTRTKAKTK